MNGLKHFFYCTKTKFLGTDKLLPFMLQLWVISYLCRYLTVVVLCTVCDWWSALCLYIRSVIPVMNVVHSWHRWFDWVGWCSLKNGCDCTVSDQFSGRYVNDVNVTSLDCVTCLPVCLAQANVEDLCTLLSWHSRICNAYILLKLSTLTSCWTEPWTLRCSSWLALGIFSCFFF